MIRRPTAALLASLALLSATACESITRSDPPTQARVVAEVTTDVPLELIVSTSFEVILDELTGNLNPGFRNADTVRLTADYDETYALNPEDSKFFVHLGNDQDGVSPVRLRVFLDGEQEYDASANLGNGGFLEYLFRFNQPTISR